MLIIDIMVERHVPLGIAVCMDLSSRNMPQAAHQTLSLFKMLLT